MHQSRTLAVLVAVATAVVFNLASMAFGHDAHATGGAGPKARASAPVRTR